MIGDEFVLLQVQTDEIDIKYDQSSCSVVDYKQIDKYYSYITKESHELKCCCEDILLL